MITTILLVFAFVFFVLGTFFSVPPAQPGAWYGRFNVVSAGLACWVFAEILTRSGLLGR
jgi:hypothetical protein